MRILLFFDLPVETTVETTVEKRAYRHFRKYLVQEGFIMLQQSVYSKLVLNGTTANLLKNKIKKACPTKGLVQVLTITEKQYANIDLMVGFQQDKVLDDDSRLTII
ncbi:CRISPR-associated endonuclease Cas2 [Brochothrix thermosphacta]|nr:CRISPR-associated endonuclease Cas2 [Brochothrix thermosphacta]MPQ28073.1 CRISPR-associated endonuclease Cas2 [Brochothrix thermosphacta]ODJ66907.1 CRISPR-associated endonuclease Cas2 [Brochothrix thermosphacta]ODJ73476.1 CRISPR-associated endonuclease Cas2 [Brochothrix thermosphacta]ODJ74848.1 CRISPR-associated endonuclease Cas2 [Brochothrix thermosphacta]